MMKILKQLAVYTTMGVGAMIGLIAGASVFTPEKITLNKETEKESE